MSYIKNSSKKVIVSVVMALMLVLAMMPGMAFAAEGDATTGSITGDIGAPEIVYTGVMNDLDEPAWTANGNAHIEWTSSDTSIATVTKTHGQVYGQDEGSVEITATLYSGSASTENQIQLGTPKSVEIEVAAGTGYGLQGEGGNTLQLTSPNNIVCAGQESRGDKNVYLNTIGTANSVGTVTAANNVITFGYTMSAGINNFKEATFNTYKNDIKILDKSGKEVEIPAADYKSFANRTVSITFDVSSLTDNEQYRLSFGPTVCGNNAAKNLNCYIDFSFVLDK